MVLIHLRQEVLEFRIQLVVVKIACEVIEAAREPFPQIVVYTLSAVGLDVIVNSLSRRIG